MKLEWNWLEDQIWIEERVEELSKGRTRDTKDFAWLFCCFCYANLGKLLQTLQQQWWSWSGTAWRIKSGLRREWRSFQEEELGIRNNLRDCFVVFAMLTFVNCCKRYNNNDEVLVKLLGRSNFGLRREWRSFQKEELEIWNNLRDCFVVFVMLTFVNCCKRYNNNDEVLVKLLGRSNLDWGESGGAFEKKTLGSETTSRTCFACMLIVCGCKAE